MTKKKKISPIRKYRSLSFKVEETVLTSQPKSVPNNLAEAKAKFMKTGKTPNFEVQDHSKLSELAGKTRNQIRFDLLGEAECILEKVRDQYGDGEFYLEHAYGPRIMKEEATPMLLEYIEENALSESLKIHWCDNMACSAKMMWRGPMVNCNKPELRKYSLWINGSDENNYMRESGIKCLMDHEIGTHFFRMLNDGFQPWFADRERFGLRSMGSFEGQCTEEGLAAIHTALRGRVRLLWGAALAYYTACKSAEMTFKQLFDHIGRYTSNPDYRWRQVMRVKRGLSDPNDLGGLGNDQCYFEGAVTILRNMDNIDFVLLMSGKICHDELDRIKRVVRKDPLRYPSFMKNMAAYTKTLKKMVSLNGLDISYPRREPPPAYLKRLSERNSGVDNTRLKKVRSPVKMVLGSIKKSKAQSRKVKGVKVNNKEKEDLEVESFDISQRFVNRHAIRKLQDKEKETKSKVFAAVETLTSDLNNLDLAVDEKIKTLQDIVKEHTWQSSDKEYIENLRAEVESERVFGEDIDSLIVSEDMFQTEEYTYFDSEYETASQRSEHKQHKQNVKDSSCGQGNELCGDSKYERKKISQKKLRCCSGKSIVGESVDTPVVLSEEEWMMTENKAPILPDLNKNHSSSPFDTQKKSFIYDRSEFLTPLSPVARSEPTFSLSPGRSTVLSSQTWREGCMSPRTVQEKVLRMESKCLASLKPDKIICFENEETQCSLESEESWPPAHLQKDEHCPQSTSDDHQGMFSIPDNGVRPKISPFLNVSDLQKLHNGCCPHAGCELSHGVEGQDLESEGETKYCNNEKNGANELVLRNPKPKKLIAQSKINLRPKCVQNYVMTSKLDKLFVRQGSLTQPSTTNNGFFFDQLPNHKSMSKFETAYRLEKISPKQLKKKLRSKAKSKGIVLSYGGRISPCQKPDLKAEFCQPFFPFMLNSEYYL